MKGTGYFAPETQAPSVDPDELEDHDLEVQDVTIEGDGVGPMGPYFERLVEEAHRCFDLAKQARSRGYDPEKEPEIPFAVDLASRVEALVGPEGVAQRIRALSETMGREALALTVSKQVAAEEFCEYDSPEAALDGAIRTGLAILTEGILVAPLEGVAHVKVRANDDGTDYADIYFAGPIRAAGGTGQAMSVLIADVVRRELGLGAYKATGSEIERFKEEIPAYKKAANLQYTPSPDEIELIVANIPVGINGEGTEQEEVSGNRDLPRVETNALRGGACLVLAEGMTLKAPKILKHVEKLGLEGWGFLDDFVKAQKQEDEGDDGGASKGPKIKPNPKYVTELVAGRPVFGHPMAPGGFRLRYGRARTAGLASTAIHPAILHLVDDFLAVGTQMKVERPGKGTVVTPCDTIEPPVVRLEDGTVIEVEGCKHALEIRDRVASILDMGEMLVPFGEFLENNKPLAQAAWCPEWWRLVVEEAGHEPPTLTDMQAARAFAFAEETDTPLHPRFTLLWHDLTTSEVTSLAEAVAEGSLEAGRLALPRQGNVKDLLERLGACHEVDATEDGDRLLLDHRCSMPVVRGAGFQATADGLDRVRTPDQSLEDPLALAARLSGVAMEPKAPCRIGARMGRPEKAAERAMSPAVHTLFPLGKAGGLQRLVKQAKEQGTIGTSSEDRGQRHRQVEVGTRHCPQCGTETLSLSCKSCQITTEIKGSRAKSRVVQIRELVEEGVERLQLPKLPDGTKGVQGLMSESRIPEPIEKGMLRAHHDISVFKDGTCRYDMTDLPLTHFRPREIGTPVETLRELGYTHDIHGDELTSPDQLLELAPQDIVVNEDGLGYMARVAEFTDDLLTRFYGLKPYYELETPEDLIGHLAVGLAPHTSGGVLCRIIGTTRAQGHWGHPYFHAAKRRNCFHGDTELLVYEDGQARKVQLRDLVEPSIETGGRPLDDHGTQVADAPAHLEILSLDPETGTPTRRPVTKLIRGTTERWIEIETTTHRSITVTPDHDVLVHRDGELTTVKAAEIRHGDEVPVGTSLPRDPVAPTVNLPAKLADHPEADRFRLRTIDGWLRELVEGIGREQAAIICQADDALVTTPSRWYASFPVSHYAALVDADLASWDDLPDDAVLGVAYDHVTLPVRIPVTPDLCRLLGLYLAEGHARSTASAHQISWRASEPELSGKIVDLVERVFGIEPSVGEDGTKVTLCSKLAYLLFTHVWETGQRAETKRVPGWCYDLPEEHITELLGGFFDGDGSVVHDPPRLRFYSKNRSLLEDVSTLLQAVGLFARFVPGKPRAPGSFLEERYAALGKPVPETLDPVHALSLAGLDVKAFAAMIHADHPVKRDRLGALSLSDLEGRNLQGAGTRGPAEERAHHLYDRVVSVEESRVDDEATYCIDIDTGSDELATKNVLLGDGLYQVRCDGDEDCIMLLLDGLLNFSRTYLPRTRGGQMDAPLTLSTRIDPQEIDKEAHNIDALFGYPRAFFEATRDNPSPKDVEDLLEMVADRLGGDRQYTEIGFTHDTASIDEGPKMSAYKTIGSMLEKMDGQLGLGRKIRAVDEADVASRVICDHFLPDIIGNLKAFSRQTVRCAKCNSKFRRIPLAGRCPKCKNTLTMTVHEASVKKYVKVAKKVAAEYNVDAYTLERLNLAQDAIASLFENDKVKKATLADFL